jgi:hypothetical protein
MPQIDNTKAPAASQSLTDAIESAEFGLEDRVTPIPPRYWWLKRLAFAVGPVVIALLCIRFGWGWIAQRQLDAEIARYVAAGQPIFPKDFDSPPVVDKDNAAKLYLDAATELKLDARSQQSWYYLSMLLENTPEDREEIATLLADNAVVLKKLRKARSLKRVDWKKRYRTPMITSARPNHLSAIRNLSKLLALATTDAEANGHINEAIGYVLDAIAQAAATDVRPTLGDHYASIAQYAMAAHPIENLIPSLHLCRDDAAAVNDPTCVQRELVDKLRRTVGDTSKMQAAMAYSTYFMRAEALDSLTAISNGNPVVLMAVTPLVASAFPRTIAFAAKPVLLADTLYAVRYLDKKARALSEPTWPGALKIMPNATPAANVVDEWTRLVSTMYTRNYQRIYVRHYSAVATGRLAGLALAIRLYELDHGERPTALVELLPDYLDELPIDPFGDGVQTFGYLPDALWPRIYTVGPNGTDDLGEVGFRITRGVHPEHLDPPFFLDGAAPQTAEELAKPRVPTNAD